LTPTRIRSRTRTLNLLPPLTFAQDLELLRRDEEALPLNLTLTLTLTLTLPLPLPLPLTLTEALPAAVRLLVELRLSRKELLRDLAREMHALARQPGACQARRELFGFGLG